MTPTMAYSMNIYNFIYCFFYNYWEKRATDGRVVGSAFIVFTLLIHFLFIAELIQSIAGIQLFSIKSFGTYAENKAIYFLFCIPFWIIIALFYNRKRTKRLLKIYNPKYSASGNKNILRVVFYIFLPMILLIILSVLRRNAY